MLKKYLLNKKNIFWLGSSWLWTQKMLEHCFLNFIIFASLRWIKKYNLRFIYSGSRFVFSTCMIWKLYLYRYLKWHWIFKAITISFLSRKFQVFDFGMNLIELLQNNNQIQNQKICQIIFKNIIIFMRLFIWIICF